MKLYCLIVNIKTLLFKGRFLDLLYETPVFTYFGKAQHRFVKPG